MHIGVVLTISHGLMLLIGFTLGIYLLPVWIAPPSPTDAQIQTMAAEALFQGKFRRELEDSDALHWGEGQVNIGDGAISFAGELAPGPDYKLYLSPEFVETEAAFLELKASMVRVGDINTFRNFLVPLPPHIDPAQYNTVIVWCEPFSQFITAAQYQ